MTDLDHLHLVHQYITNGWHRPRQLGYTYYQCHVLCGYLEVCQNEKLFVMVLSYQRVTHFMRTLSLVLEEHGIKIDKFDRGRFTVTFKNNTNKVKFISTSDNSNCDYFLDSFDRGVDPNQYYIEDLD